MKPRASDAGDPDHPKLPKALLGEVESELLAMRRARVPITVRNLRKRVRKGSRMWHALKLDDDRAAAELWRREECRRWIAAITITVTDGARPVRAYRSVVIARTSGADRKEYVERRIYTASPKMLDSISADEYAQMVSAARRIRDDGLPKHDRAWATICAAIENNPPMAVS